MKESETLTNVTESFGEQFASTTDVAKTAMMVVGLFATVYFVTGKAIKLSHKLHNRKS